MGRFARRRLIVGNWKMNKTPAETESFLKQLVEQTPETRNVSVVVCPPFTSLSVAAQILEKKSVLLGAQNVHWEKGGAYTGEVSARMLRDLYVTHVIIGHSERRTYFGETLEQISKKVRMALSAGLRPILCVGESLEERESKKETQVVEQQLISALIEVPKEQLEKVIIAYEPVWAIGTGKTATPEIAQEMHRHIRQALSEKFGAELAKMIPILYGGSMKAANASSLLAQPDIDGGLIGGASLDLLEFIPIIRCADGN